MKGTLYVCATPIGNLKDITLRCIETLKFVDLIAAEDTRHTIKILNYYDIKTPLESYYEHNKNVKGRKLLNILESGKNIALVSDAGMPGISDPGEDLIRLCYENNIPLTVLPGATASVTALVLSGIKTRSYCFEGFLPSGKKARKTVLQKLKAESRTTVFYEAPHKLLDTLKELYEEIGERQISVVKEITKKNETVLRGEISYIIEYFLENTPKGEYVIVLSGISEEESKNIAMKAFENITIEESVQSYIEEGLNINDAMKKAAKERGISKKKVYEIIKIKKNKS